MFQKRSLRQHCTIIVCQFQEVTKHPYYTMLLLLSPHLDACQCFRHLAMLQVPRQWRQVALLLHQRIKQAPSGTTAAAGPQLFPCMQQQ
jgi:hypothetical protein